MTEPSDRDIITTLERKLRLRSAARGPMTAAGLSSSAGLKERR